MADHAARIAQLEAEVASLRADAERRDRTLAETLEQQTATAEVLRVIASSPTNLTQVLDAVAETARRLCGAFGVGIQRPVGEQFGTTGQSRGPLPPGATETSPGPLDRRSGPGRAYLARELVHIPDIDAVADEYPEGYVRAQVSGWRAQASAPLLHGGDVAGALTLY